MISNIAVCRKFNPSLCILLFVPWYVVWITGVERSTAEILEVTEVKPLCLKLHVSPGSKEYSTSGIP